MSELPPAHAEIVGSGTPVLLLHGWGSSAELMKPIADALAAKHKFVLIDFPGHGGTDPPPEAWDVQAFVSWTFAVMDRLGIESFDLVGHSHGGRVAIGMALAHPERIKKLVLVDSAGLRTAPSLRAKIKVKVFKLARRASNAVWLPSPFRAGLQKWVARQGSDDYRAASGVMRETLVKLVNSDARASLPNLKLPTLLVWGDRDDQTPISQAHEMEHLIPDAGLVVLQGAGHFAYAEQLARFCAVVDSFLEVA